MNLLLRFALELAALAVFGYWGWSQSEGQMRWLIAFIAPIVVAAVWAVFRVPGDGGTPAVVVSGLMRLLLEFVLFALAVGALFALDRSRLALLLGLVIIIHYALSYERVAWLLRGGAA